MAIKINNKVQRNLQEQVAKNAQDITDFLSGIGYMGPYDTTSAIPTTDYKEGQLYIVGTTSTTWHIYKYDETDGFTDLGAAPYLKDQTALLDSLQSQITSNDTDISSLQTRATTAESNISSLQSEVTTVKNTYVPETDFTATVEELEDDIATNKTDITAIKADYVTTDTTQTISGNKTFTGTFYTGGWDSATDSWLYTESDSNWWATSVPENLSADYASVKYFRRSVVGHVLKIVIAFTFNPKSVYDATSSQNIAIMQFGINELLNSKLYPMNSVAGNYLTAVRMEDPYVDTADNLYLGKTTPVQVRVRGNYTFGTAEHGNTVGIQLHFDDTTLDAEIYVRREFSFELEDSQL